MDIWLTLLGMALVTYAARALPLIVMRKELPAWLTTWLSFVPVAIYTALVVPPLLVKQLDQGPSLRFGAEVLAGIVAAIVAWRNGNILLTIIAGLLCFWLLRWLGL
jgi:branched-subunit amino acid transport protein